LLKVARIKCDSLNLSYVKVIDEQRNQIVLLKSINDQDNKQLIDKDKQIKNLTDQNTNLEKNVKLCDDQKDNDQKEIDGLKKDIKKTKWKSLGGGFLVGVVVTLVTVLLIP
jgi:peptidoglycan hydrolase CwlO-like protein